MNGNWKWYLGQSGTLGASVQAVYGASVPLSSCLKDVWVQRCPYCGFNLSGPHSQGSHRTIAPGPETLWLAKLYANVLRAAWYALGMMKGKVPTIACAAKVAYVAGGQQGAAYYLAGPSGSKPLHSILPLTTQVTVGDLETNLPVYLLGEHPLPQRPSALNPSSRVLFADDVLDHALARLRNASPGTPYGLEDVARALLPSRVRPTWIDHVKGLSPGTQGSTPNPILYYMPHSVSDTDKHNQLFLCTEQRVLLCHRSVSSQPAAEGLPDVSGTLRLEEMTVALVDDHQKQEDPFAIWWRVFDFGSGFPMHPCNTCRIVIPALLCEQQPSATPFPDRTLIVQERS